MARRRPPRGAGEGLLRPPRPEGVLALDDMVAALVELDANGLCLQWRKQLGGTPPAHLPRWLLMKILAYRIQATAFGGLDKARCASGASRRARGSDHRTCIPSKRGLRINGKGPAEGRGSPASGIGRIERVMILDKGFAWNGEIGGSSSQVAAGDDRHKLERPSLLRLANGEGPTDPGCPPQVRGLRRRCARCSPYRRSKTAEPRSPDDPKPAGDVAMRSERGKTTLRCAVYTRVSTEHGPAQEFNSLDNQREASEAYVKSQAHEGWRLIRTHYDDGGYSGGSMDRPVLQRRPR